MIGEQGSALSYQDQLREYARIRDALPGFEKAHIQAYTAWRAALRTGLAPAELEELRIAAVQAQTKYQLASDLLQQLRQALAIDI